MTITHLWPTTVHTAVLARDQTARVAEDPSRLPGTLPPDHPGRTLPWHSRTEDWGSGFHAGLRHGSGPWCALLVLDTIPDEPPADEHSGALILHDPRAGAANVALPGPRATPR
jgi:hypothetical protein